MTDKNVRAISGKFYMKSGNIIPFVTICYEDEEPFNYKHVWDEAGKRITEVNNLNFQDWEDIDEVKFIDWSNVEAIIIDGDQVVPGWYAEEVVNTAFEKKTNKFYC